MKANEEILSIMEIADALHATFKARGKLLEPVEGLQIATVIHRNLIESERNEILKKAFVITVGYPSALEKIAMIMNEYNGLKEGYQRTLDNLKP